MRYVITCNHCSPSKVKRESLFKSKSIGLTTKFGTLNALRQQVLPNKEHLFFKKRNLNKRSNITFWKPVNQQQRSTYWIEGRPSWIRGASPSWGQLPYPPPVRRYQGCDDEILAMSYWLNCLSSTEQNTFLCGWNSQKTTCHFSAYVARPDRQVAEFPRTSVEVDGALH